MFYLSTIINCSKGDLCSYQTEEGKAGKPMVLEWKAVQKSLALSLMQNLFHGDFLDT